MFLEDPTVKEHFRYESYGNKHLPYVRLDNTSMYVNRTMMFIGFSLYSSCSREFFTSCNMAAAKEKYRF